MEKKARLWLDAYAPRAAMLLLLVLLAWVLAHWTWLWLEPQQPLSAAHTTAQQFDLNAAAQSIGAAHLFGQAATRVSSGEVEMLSTLNIRVKGIFAAVGTLPGFAIVNTDAKTDQPVRVGMEIQPGVLLQAVYPRHIIVSNNGIDERVNLEGKDTASLLQTREAVVTATGSNRYAISHSEWLATMQQGGAANLGRISQNPGGGMLVEAAPSGSLAEKIGLQQGDVVRMVNGSGISSQADVIRLAQQFNPGTQVNIEVMRAGRPVNLSYTVQH